jgi:hypothetical protein
MNIGGREIKKVTVSTDKGIFIASFSDEEILTNGKVIVDVGEPDEIDFYQVLPKSMQEEEEVKS